MAPLIRVDRSSPVPLYYQVAQRLEELIEAGRMPPGYRLENEIALADQLGLSRPTMRQAIQHLVDKGLLVRKRGVGTQVVHGRVRRQVELSSLYDDLGDVYFVAAGLMPDLDLRPAFHQQVAYKASWHEIGDDAPQHAEMPG